MSIEPPCPARPSAAGAPQTCHPLSFTPTRLLAAASQALQAQGLVLCPLVPVESVQGVEVEVDVGGQTSPKQYASGCVPGTFTQACTERLMSVLKSLVRSASLSPQEDQGEVSAI